MSDKKNWDEFPCKECLLKGNCRERCFIWPTFGVISTYVKINQLEDTCLSCGSSNVFTYTNIQWGCDNCYV